MRLSRDVLMADAGASGFRAEILEKCELLLGLLQGMADDPFLGPRLALKGGTALNLFVFDVPRLSLDADMNYIGGADVGTMETERPLVEAAIGSVCQHEDFRIGRTPNGHAGGKWHLAYCSHTRRPVRGARAARPADSRSPAAWHNDGSQRFIRRAPPG